MQASLVVHEMTVVYWGPELACDPGNCPDGTFHLHCANDWQVVQAYMWVQRAMRRSVTRNTPTTLIGEPFNCRYYCITGPGGLVKEILWSEDEIGDSVKGML